MYCEDIERKIEMKKAILALAIVGSVTSGNCFNNGNRPLNLSDSQCNATYAMVTEFPESLKQSVNQGNNILDISKLPVDKFNAIYELLKGSSDPSKQDNALSDTDHQPEKENVQEESVIKKAVGVTAVGTITGVAAAYLFVPGFSDLVKTGVQVASGIANGNYVPVNPLKQSEKQYNASYLLLGQKGSVIKKAISGIVCAAAVGMIASAAVIYFFVPGVSKLVNPIVRKLFGVDVRENCVVDDSKQAEKDVQEESSAKNVLQPYATAVSSVAGMAAIYRFAPNVSELINSVVQLAAENGPAVLSKAQPYWNSTLKNGFKAWNVVKKHAPVVLETAKKYGETALNKGHDIWNNPQPYWDSALNKGLDIWNNPQPYWDSALNKGLDIWNNSQPYWNSALKNGSKALDFAKAYTKEKGPVVLEAIREYGSKALNKGSIVLNSAKKYLESNNGLEAQSVPEDIGNSENVLDYVSLFFKNIEYDSLANTVMNGYNSIRNIANPVYNRWSNTLTKSATELFARLQENDKFKEYFLNIIGETSAARVL